MRYVLVRESDNVVVNVVDWDGDTQRWAPPAGVTALPIAARGAIGDTWVSGETFTPRARPTTRRDTLHAALESVEQTAGGGLLVLVQALKAYL